ncbi:unnamed protein product [Rotaria sp. Silwood2]|nr:unnamed protein product [Rotaria sp. Silwood2]CAF2944398.1 unnamed protein product [Rotaria sp. Silwood2]CAF3369558.1 unnamed protein product [Rotaria sp. Silwood2]CAF4211936.1 unnamed protein product [Rotaria sp. Silwood2]CAF4346256.1 unnamed protein product [Rotaria sp. Silwood2]
MLAEDDATSVCSKVVSLIVDVPCHGMNLSHRFPNIHTLTVLSTHKPDLGNFRRLRHLVTNNMELVSCLAQRINTLTLINDNGANFKTIICSHVHHLTISNFYVNNVNTITSLMPCFPNLHSLHIQFRSNAAVFRDSLDILFDVQQRPDFKLLRTNWIPMDFHDYKSIKMWIADNTELKSRSIPFHGHCDGKSLTVWL